MWYRARIVGAPLAALLAAACGGAVRDGVRAAASPLATAVPRP
jgi:hypothetical protein